ncbi:LysR family transcriptional regulator [Bordetella sp. 2513F-2]
MRDLDLTTLRLYVLVCEARSIARAAEQARMVGSAISKRLAQLEDTVGVPLLQRRRRGVVPTPAGETLLQHARAMLAHAGMVERDMAAYARGVRGQVRILATASVLAESLAEDVAAFLRNPAHADISVDIEERLSTGVVRGVREGEASLGICWDAAEFHGLASRPYRSDRLAVVMHRGHPLSRRRSLRFEDTLDEEHVTMPTASAVLILLQRAASQAGRSMRHRVTVSNFDSAFRVVQARLAICVAPLEVAQRYADADMLSVVPLSDPWAWRRFALCTRAGESLPAAAQLLADHLAGLAHDPPG